MDELFAAEAALQAEAGEVSRDLGLDQRLSAIGRPLRVGSAALGVMVRRDLDYDVDCASLDAATSEAVAGLGAVLAVHPRVRQVTLRDDTGAWNVDPLYPDGLYIGVQYRSALGHDWTLDLWFVDEPDRQPSSRHVHDLLPALTPERRAAILAIKQARCALPEQRSMTSSFDVYRAVLDGGVRSVAEFDAWAARQP